MAGDWQSVALSELTDPDTPVTYGVVKPGPEDPNGVWFVRGGDIADGRVLTQQLRTITPEVSMQYRRTQLRGGEIVVSLVGNPGQVAIVPESLKGANIARQAGLVRLRKGVDTRFVKYFLSSPAGQEALGAHSLGSVQQVINLRDLKTVRVPLPSLSEQRAIAHILGTPDDKIELNRRMSETLEQMARALFKSWFVDFEPVRAKIEGRWQRGESLPGLPAHLYDLFTDRLVDSELGEIPEGWEVIGLDQIARFINGLALQKYPSSDERSLPVIKIAQLRSGRVDDADRASADLDPDYIVADGDILFSWSGSLECVLWTGGLGALNQHLFKVTSSNYPRWLCYFAIHQHLEAFRHIAAGKATTMGHIQRRHLSDAKIAVPSKFIPREIDRLISPLFDSAWKRQVESRTLAALRDALLPKLISGEIRVKDAEEFIGRAV
jgi:type I restriction enzyme, S subunit